MTKDAERLRELAKRASRGDGSAAGALLGELEPRMVFIVRRVMRSQVPKSPLVERILLEAGRVQGQKPSLAQGQQQALVAQVARNVCQSLLDQLRCAPDGWSTICDTMRL